MDGLHVVLFNAAKPGAFEMKDQVMGLLIIMVLLRQTKTDARKDMAIGLHLKTQMAVERPRTHQPFRGEQEGGLWVALAKGLQGLERSG